MKTYKEILEEIKAVLLASGEYDEYTLDHIGISLENGEDADAPDVETVATRFNLNEMFKTERGYSIGEVVEYARAIFDEDGDIVEYETIGYDIIDFYWHKK